MPITSALRVGARTSADAAAGALVLGLVTTLYGATGAFNSAGFALNRVFRVEEGRGFVGRKLNSLLWTLVVLVLVNLTCVLVFLGGGLAADVLGLIGLGDNVAAVVGLRALAGRAARRRCSSTRSSTTPRRTSRCATGGTSRRAPCSA